MRHPIYLYFLMFLVFAIHRSFVAWPFFKSDFCFFKVYFVKIMAWLHTHPRTHTHTHTHTPTHKHNEDVYGGYIYTLCRSKLKMALLALSTKHLLRSQSFSQSRLRANTFHCILLYFFLQVSTFFPNEKIQLNFFMFSMKKTFFTT